MYIHNFNPVFINLGFIEIKWYSMAYILGILVGWWLAKKILVKRLKNLDINLNINYFDDLVSYLIIGIILGGRIGYIIFYNLEYYFKNPLDVIKIWEGGMSFHGGVMGVIFGTYLFSLKKNIPLFFLLDIIACVSPIGIFFGRIANFINGELVGKATNVFWGVVFPKIDNITRHPSQLYEAFLEGLVLFIIMNLIIFKNNYKSGYCSIMFLILYGCFRIFSEIFRLPDEHVGYLFNLISMGTMLSVLMILAGVIILLRKKDV